MNKIAKYLNEHMLGEVTAAPAVRERFSHDAGVLSITPELVLFPRVTNDIRKAARFSWQLAEKGHNLTLTARGGGTDQTGASLGAGLIINTTAHLTDILYIATKEKVPFVHVQPGITLGALHEALRWQGMTIPVDPENAAYSTVGGAVANNTGGQYSATQGTIGDWVTRLEVVLANGDVIETSRLSKREVSKKKGLQTLEGELYRQIDGLIEDNQQLIDEKIAVDDRDNTGYSGIAKVRQKDGSLDLTPLFVGSQGTLGIISEVVLKTAFYSKEQAIVVIALETLEVARDAIDALRELQSATLELFDGALFTEIASSGKRYAFATPGADVAEVGAVIYLTIDDFAERARTKKLRRLAKIMERFTATILTTEDHTPEELQAVRSIHTMLQLGAAPEIAYPPILDGASIPANRQEDFAEAIALLAKKHHVALPLHIRALDGVVTVRPNLQLSRVGDKQKVFKLIHEYTALVASFDGSILAEAGEGRLKTHAIYSGLDPEVYALYQAIRAAFDPHATLNTGVKQKNEIKALAAQLRSSYSGGFRG